MLLTKSIQDTIIEKLGGKTLIAIGEIHGAKENPEILSEIIDLVNNKNYIPVVGFELPQKLIDNPEELVKEVLSDGRYSNLHKNLITNLKRNGVKVFGFDISEEQWEQVKNNGLSWRDTRMAENVNIHLANLKQNEKMIIICGDAHFTTKEITIKSTKPNGEILFENFSPMGSRISVESLLALHLRYQSGKIFNHKLKDIQPITLTKKHVFRESDALLEVDIKEAHPTNL